MIIPALDLINGCVVRLKQGSYQEQKYYSNKPSLCLQNYINQGAKKIHLVDLDGARNPKKRQINLLHQLLSKFNNSINIQIGGGIRDIKDIKYLLNLGINKIILSSIAITKIQLVKQWFKYFNPNIIILALDIRINNIGKNIISINGWQKNSKFQIEEILQQYTSIGLKHVLCTDISKDGTLSGSNIQLYTYLCKNWPNISFQASGGICSVEEIKKLKNCGVHDIIIGRAFLEEKITIQEAIRCWQNE